MKYSKNTIQNLTKSLFKSGGKVKTTKNVTVKYRKGGDIESLQKQIASKQKELAANPSRKVEIENKINNLISKISQIQSEKLENKGKSRKEKRLEKKIERQEKRYNKKNERPEEVKDLTVTSSIKTSSFYPKLNKELSSNTDVTRRTGLGKGDQWSYKKEGDKFYASKPGTNKWIEVNPNTTAGKAVKKVIAHNDMSYKLGKGDTWNKADYDYQNKKEVKTDDFKKEVKTDDVKLFPNLETIKKYFVDKSFTIPQSDLELGLKYEKYDKKVGNDGVIQADKIQDFKDVEALYKEYEYFKSNPEEAKEMYTNPKVKYITPEKVFLMSNPDKAKNIKWEEFLKIKGGIPAHSRFVKSEMVKGNFES